MDQMGQWGGGEGCTRVVAVASQNKKERKKKTKKSKINKSEQKDPRFEPGTKR